MPRDSPAGPVTVQSPPPLVPGGTLKRMVRAQLILRTRLSDKLVTPMKQIVFINVDSSSGMKEFMLIKNLNIMVYNRLDLMAWCLM